MRRRRPPSRPGTAPPPRRRHRRSAAVRAAASSPRLPGLLLATVVLAGLGLAGLLLPGLLAGLGSPGGPSHGAGSAGPGSPTPHSPGERSTGERPGGERSRAGGAGGEAARLPHLFPGGPVDAQEDAGGAGLPRVEVEVPPVETTVGDRVALRLVVATEPNGFAPRFPAWGENWGEAEVVEVTEPSRATAEGSPATTWQQTVTVAAFRPGRIPLPPQEIVIPTADGRSRRLATPADLALEVVSVLPEPPEGEEGDAPIPEPEAEKGLVELPAGAPFWWTAALMALAVAALLALLWRRHREAEGAAPRPRLVPIEELRRSLSDARTVPAPEEGLARVSLALRRYLGRRLGFPAAEGTTTEVRRQLAARHLPDGLPERCGRLLAACDLVKFARQPARPEDVERWAAVAAELGDRVEGHLRPAEEAAERAERRAENRDREAAA